MSKSNIRKKKTNKPVTLKPLILVISLQTDMEIETNDLKILKP